LYPAKQTMLDSLYSAYLTSHSISTTDPGLAVGEASGHQPCIRITIVRLFPSRTFFGNNSPGQWRSAVPMAFLFMAFSEPFTLNRESRSFRPEPPPADDEHEVTRGNFDEVKNHRRQHRANQRTADHGSFPGPGNFVAQWNEATRRIAIANVNNIGDSARLFALANLAGCRFRNGGVGREVFLQTSGDRAWRSRMRHSMATGERNRRRADYLLREPPGHAQPTLLTLRILTTCLARTG
jgi:hypothetical protein